MHVLLMQVSHNDARKRGSAKRKYVRKTILLLSRLDESGNSQMAILYREMSDLVNRRSDVKKLLNSTYKFGS